MIFWIFWLCDQCHEIGVLCQAANVEKAVEQLKSEGLDVDGMVSAKESSSYDVIHIIIMTLKIIIIIVATTILTRFAMLGSRLTGALCWSQQSKGNDLILVSVLLMLNTSMKVGRSGHIGVQCSSQPLLWTHPWLP